MRRRKPSVVWLPQTNANSLGMVGTNVYQRFQVDVVGPSGAFSVGEIPLVIDDTHDPLLPETTLADVEDSGYRLRRIVGKVWTIYQQVDADTPNIVIATAGIIVRRTDITTGGSNAVAADPTGGIVSPGEIQNTADPWVWRRSWLLGNNDASAPSGGFAGNTLPADNQFFSAVDGPHVDQKTARIIGPEERLFLDVSLTVVEGGTNQLIVGQLIVLTDLRVLGSMRTSIGNRRNASR